VERESICIKVCVLALILGESAKGKATHFLASFGGFGLIAVGIIDSSVVPTFGSLDALTIIFAAAHKNLWWYYGMMAAIGSIIGAYISYVLGRKAGKQGLEKKFGRDRLRKVYEYYDRRGFWAVFIPSILPPPFPTSPFLVSAGALDFSLRKFLIAVSSGRTIRYLGFAAIGAFYGRSLIGYFQAHKRPLLITMTILAISGGSAIGLYMWRQHKEHKRGGHSNTAQPKAA
jgi:membrane protein YqaA with SNARE-associated domain